MSHNSFSLYLSTAEDLLDLTDAECGQLIRAVFDYAKDKKPPRLAPPVMMVFRRIRRYLDADAEKFRLRCEQNRRAGKISAQVRREAAAKCTGEDGCTGRQMAGTNKT